MADYSHVNKETHDVEGEGLMTRMSVSDCCIRKMDNMSPLRPAVQNKAETSRKRPGSRATVSRLRP